MKWRPVENGLHIGATPASLVKPCEKTLKNLPPRLHQWDTCVSTICPSAEDVGLRCRERGGVPGDIIASLLRDMGGEAPQPARENHEEKGLPPFVQNPAASVQAF
jgi:hypothetical protein